MKALSKFRLAAILSLLLIFALSLTVQAADIDKLLKSLEDEDYAVRSKAAFKLGEKKVQSAIEPLVKMLTSDKVYNVRIVAAVALYKIGNESVLPILKKQSEKDKNASVRAVIKGIVKKFEKKEKKLSQK